MEMRRGIFICTFWAAVGCSALACSDDTDDPGAGGGPDGATTDIFVAPPPKLGCAKRSLCTEPYCDQVLIPSGTYSRGTTNAPWAEAHFKSGDARPVHLVELDAFCIDKYEVSLERFENCVDAKKCSPAGLLWRESIAPYETTVNHYPSKCSPDRAVCKDFAVNGKNYWQAHNYCTWIGSRLCTEAEWERVANGPGTKKRKHPWGDTSPTAALTNIKSVSLGYVEPVNSHPTGVSVEGVYNMAGNVYEWVRDAYAPYKPAAAGSALKNPSIAPTSAKSEVVARGSCFFTEPKDTVTDRSVMKMAFDWG